MNIHRIKYYIACILFATATNYYAIDFTTTTNQNNESTQTITIYCNLDEINNEMILANSLHASIDHPSIIIEEMTIDTPSMRKYVPELKQKKKVYDHNFIISIKIKAINKFDTNQAKAYLSYLSTLNSSILELQIPISFQKTEPQHLGSDIQKNHIMPIPNQLEIEKNNESWATTIQNLVEKTKSPWTQILFALLLGLLLSLTPCIYPMIPITIGILHSQGKKSLLHDFLASICYASGLATTFACLGLVATVAGSSFGSLLSQPYFVIALVIFIGYMSLTMIGIIEMYIPPFMKGEIKLYKNFGPFFAAYLFGAISGTVASPCVSPGLALLLSIVATIGNKILGFLLLFSFGIGLSIPLIIIGTFSNALYLLPKSGMWMVEIKKGLGFFMLATCFYYLANILPIAIVYWLFTGYLLFIAIFYLFENYKKNTKEYTFLYTCISILMISLTMVMIIKSYEKTFYKDQTQEESSIDWQTHYRIALDQALEKNKLLLIDFWANHCTICKAIDKKVFQNNLFYQSLSDKIVFLKIDATHNNNPDYIHTRELYKIYAQPTILLINPKTETVMHKWTSEPYSLPLEEFIEQIEKQWQKITTHL